MTTDRLTEFYLERQGRPASSIAMDFDKGTPIVFGHTISYLEGEFAVLEEVIERMSNEQIAILQKLLVEIIQLRLHAASMSDADVDEKSVREVSL